MISFRFNAIFHMFWSIWFCRDKHVTDHRDTDSPLSPLFSFHPWKNPCILNEKQFDSVLGVDGPDASLHVNVRNCFTSGQCIYLLRVTDCFLSSCRMVIPLNDFMADKEEEGTDIHGDREGTQSVGLSWTQRNAKVSKTELRSRYIKWPSFV